ncbi:2-polyprenyl-6-methoxyphenol hydroxylase-like FAD-dependent oxidoreductase [Brevibacterium sanguinis]|uniref:2-polyprenyl-6-methoxyphenol hydroxylase-like FAD-dependent oxidoreductase n=2 Tax=Brevibacterium TaxID=1696 RepID=A0A366IKE6_9MICO|nr:MULTISPECIES: NAD(P)/FAD-dependent oxidoreductase [Brevibacterium]RBP66231.1 2-polyprenyl-6-methoxyphenol hydroxylase-like FAD-dependent oxidoreductase [Brevibacterium sanguinis]RBP72882.1 2-polyprenyl-6-methoxyphenol hydroxylase-like FAD-dependent oxidoreductase [Brevibacterium celere]
MIIPRSVDEQYAAAAGDEVRILIVGGGIAGITLAQLLRARGRHPVLIERSPDLARMTDDNHAGYMLALMPMVDPVFTELEVWDEYRERSVEIDRYTFHSRTGDVIRSDRLGRLLDPYGEYRGIARGALIDVLATADCPIAFGTTVTDLSEDETVTVELETAASEPDPTDAEATSLMEEFDLVVIADGLNSRTRRFVPGGRSLGSVDTAWGGWVAWAPADADPRDGSELWGDGFFLGAYPVKDRIGIFLGCPDSRQPLGPRRFAAEVRGKLENLSPRLDSALTAVAEADDPFFWPLRDARTSRWATGRTVLLGDAAAGFLPTAGIGAGMAMESAWALGRRLAETDRRSLPDDLRAYEQGQRPRVESAQDNSRQLAGLMFSDSTILAVLREKLLGLLSVKVALKPIIALLDTPAAASADNPSLPGPQPWRPTPTPA